MERNLSLPSSDVDHVLLSWLVEEREPRLVGVKTSGCLKVLDDEGDLLLDFGLDDLAD